MTQGAAYTALLRVLAAALVFLLAAQPQAAVGSSGSGGAGAGYRVALVVPVNSTTLQAQEVSAPLTPLFTQSCGNDSLVAVYGPRHGEPLLVVVYTRQGATSSIAECGKLVEPCLAAVGAGETARAVAERIEALAAKLAAKSKGSKAAATATVQSLTVQQAPLHTQPLPLPETTTTTTTTAAAVTATKTATAPIASPLEGQAAASTTTRAHAHAAAGEAETGHEQVTAKVEKAVAKGGQGEGEGKGGPSPLAPPPMNTYTGRSASWSEEVVKPKTPPAKTATVERSLLVLGSGFSAAVAVSLWWRRRL